MGGLEVEVAFEGGDVVGGAEQSERVVVFVLG